MVKIAFNQKGAANPLAFTLAAVLHLDMGHRLPCTYQCNKKVHAVQLYWKTPQRTFYISKCFVTGFSFHNLLVNVFCFGHQPAIHNDQRSMLVIQVLYCSSVGYIFVDFHRFWFRWDRCPSYLKHRHQWLRQIKYRSCEKKITIFYSPPQRLPKATWQSKC